PRSHLPRHLPAPPSSDLRALTDPAAYLPVLDPPHAAAHRRLVARFVRYHLGDAGPLSALDFWERRPWVLPPLTPVPPLDPAPVPSAASESAPPGTSTTARRRSGRPSPESTLIGGPRRSAAGLRSISGSRPYRSATIPRP